MNKLYMYNLQTYYNLLKYILKINVHNTCISVSPKGWYHGAPPPVSLAPLPFNFKAYAEKRCFKTLIEHC